MGLDSECNGPVVSIRSCLTWIGREFESERYAFWDSISSLVRPGLMKGSAATFVQNREWPSAQYLQNWQTWSTKMQVADPFVTQLVVLASLNVVTRNSDISCRSSAGKRRSLDGGEVHAAEMDLVLWSWLTLTWSGLDFESKRHVPIYNFSTNILFPVKPSLLYGTETLVQRSEWPRAQNLQNSQTSSRTRQTVDRLWLPQMLWQTARISCREFQVEIIRWQRLKSSWAEMDLSMPSGLTIIKPSASRTFVGIVYQCGGPQYRMK